MSIMTIRTLLAQGRSQLWAASLILALSGFAACGDDDEPPPDDVEDAGIDAGEDKPSTDAGQDAGGGGDCIKNPTTHLEIINACTDAEVVEKDPVLPLLLSDGGLPPLP
ncbi:MAG: hypothetical protein ABW321_17095 [Polyangiales bacterium]